jgi:hypothetical protein
MKMCLQGIVKKKRVKISSGREKATSVAVGKNNVGHFQ